MGDASEASKRAREGSPRQGGAPSPQRARVADDAAGDAGGAAPAPAPLAAALSAPPAPATAATGDGHHGHAPHGAHSAPAAGGAHAADDDAPPPPPRSLLEQALEDVAPSLHLNFAEYERVGQLGKGSFGTVLHMRRRGLEPGAPAGIAVAVKQASEDDVADALSCEEDLVKELLVYRRLGCPSDEEGWCVRTPLFLRCVQTLRRVALVSRHVARGGRAARMRTRPPARRAARSSPVAARRHTRSHALPHAARQVPARSLPRPLHDSAAGPCA
jgi:hypothetical protein